MPYTPILATLAYVLSADGASVLMVHRSARPDDQHNGKWNGLGGKLERDEHVLAGLRRELREEAGIELEVAELRGTLSWPGFGRNGEDWFGFVFLVRRWSGLVPERNAEGELHWIPLGALGTLPMWDGDRHFLPLVFDGDPRPFHGRMPYADGRPLGWQVERL